jgi:imidazolonepropionase
MQKTKWDTLWVNASLATMARADSDYSAVADGVIAVSGEDIAWVGPRVALVGDPSSLAVEVIDAGGCWITPGLIDCHTHLVYGGHRAREFELRLQGATYEEIARAGGGIRATVAATREAGERALFQDARKRVEALLKEGVTTIEIKSGYGLDRGTEAKMLRVAQSLGDHLPVTVLKTFLGAHAVPEEFDGDADRYVDQVCNDMMPRIASLGLIDAVDAFCETIGFSREQTRRVFEAARCLDLPVKLHAEQLSNQQGAELAAEYGALSADHLEYIDEQGVLALRAAGTVAVLLPGAFYFLRETRVPPVDSFREHEVPMAIASDCNPGSSPAQSLLLMMNMACTFFRLTPGEALAGVTRNAARALGRGERIGTLEAGKTADFVLWNIDTPAELAYGIGANPCAVVVRGGAVVLEKAAENDGTVRSIGS